MCKGDAFGSLQPKPAQSQKAAKSDLTVVTEVENSYSPNTDSNYFSFPTVIEEEENSKRGESVHHGRREWKPEFTKISFGNK